MSAAPLLRLTRPFAAADFARIRQLQIEGLTLSEIAIDLGRSSREVNVATHVKLGRPVAEAVEIVNRTYEVAGEAPGDGRAALFRRMLAELFGGGRR